MAVHEGINRLYLQAAYKRDSLERKVANRVLLSDGLARRDDELAEQSGGRGAILATRWRQADAARAIGHFFSKRLKAQTAPQRQKNFSMPGPLACIGPITCLPALRTGARHTVLPAISFVPPVCCTSLLPKYLTEPSLVRRAATFRHPLRYVGCLGLGAIGTRWMHTMQTPIQHPHCTICVAQPSSDPDWEKLIKADCAVPGSRSSRRVRHLFENTSLLHPHCSLSYRWLALASSRRTIL